MGKVLTGALAIIRQNGVAIGKMRNVRLQETIRRARVSGLGTILPQEQAAVEWSGTLSCSFYEINFFQSGIRNGIRRDVANKQEFENQLVLDSEGVQIDIFKKISDVVDAETGLIGDAIKPYATVTRCLIDNESIDISEGQISGRDQSFMYLDPVLLKGDDPEA